MLRQIVLVPWHTLVLQHSIDLVDVGGEGRVILCECGKVLGTARLSPRV